eukprot:scaffold46631_cov63-Phaeocystis_antarctica.AAC.4
MASIWQALLIAAPAMPLGDPSHKGASAVHIVAGPAHDGRATLPKQRRQMLRAAVVGGEAASRVGGRVVRDDAIVSEGLRPYSALLFQRGLGAAVLEQAVVVRDLLVAGAVLQDRHEHLLDGGGTGATGFEEHNRPP